MTFTSKDDRLVNYFLIQISYGPMNSHCMNMHQLQIIIELNLQLLCLKILSVWHSFKKKSLCNGLKIDPIIASLHPLCSFKTPAMTLSGNFNPCANITHSKCQIVKLVLTLEFLPVQKPPHIFLYRTILIVIGHKFHSS